MRRFLVGDRVRWENRADGTPRWNFDSDRGRETETCIVMSGVVVMVTPYAFGVRSDDGKEWFWPQPDKSNARYGLTGYLELVAAVEDHGIRVTTLPGRTRDTSTRRITVQELAGKIEEMLLPEAVGFEQYQSFVYYQKWADDLFRKVAKERAQSIAEALRGVEVEK